MFEQMVFSDFPRTLILTEDELSVSHGTGASILRLLADVPQERLLNGFTTYRGRPELKAWQLSIPEQWSELVELIQSGYVQFIYSTMFSDAGFELFEKLLLTIPQSIPVVHHAHDFYYRDRKKFGQLLRRIAPRVQEFWGAEKAIAAELELLTGRKVELMSAMHCEIPELKNRHYRDLDENFQIVMLGNVYLPSCFELFISIWREILQIHPWLKPIQWFAHPSSAEFYRTRGLTFEPIIEYRGFAEREELHRRLTQADLGLVLFNSTDIPEMTYSSYSVPTRMTEYACAGLPIFAAAGIATDTFRFINENNIGIGCALERRKTFITAFEKIISDSQMRRQFGINVRNLAETQFDISKRRNIIARRLTQMGL